MNRAPYGVESAGATIELRLSVLILEGFGGRSNRVKLKHDIGEGARLKWSDVAYDANDSAVKVRREMESAFGRSNAAAAAH